MKKYSLLTGLLLGSLLMASQAMALVNAPATITMPPTPDADGTFQIKWVKSTTTGAVSSLEEATLADFSDAAVVYTGTGNYATRVKGTTAATYYYRVRATKAGDVDGPSAYTVGANGVEVANRLAAPTSIFAPATDVDGSFTVVVSRLPAGTTYVIEQSIDGGPFAQIYAGTTYYKAIKNGATPATYSYRALARKAGTPDSSYTAAVDVVVSPYTGSTTLAAANPTEGAAWASSSHSNPNNLGPGSGSCVACHSPTGEKTAKGYGVISCEGCHGIATGGNLPASSIAADDSCATCHNSHYSGVANLADAVAGNAHGTVNSCANCHNPHDLTVNQPRRVDTLAVLDGNCVTCHGEKTTEQLKINPFNDEIPARFVTSRHATQSARTGNCGACHSNQGGQILLGLNVKPIGAALTAAYATAAGADFLLLPVGSSTIDGVNRKTCTTCHEMHDMSLLGIGAEVATGLAPSNGSTNVVDTTRTVFSAEYNLCTTCHSVKLDATFVPTEGYSGRGMFTYALSADYSAANLLKGDPATYDFSNIFFHDGASGSGRTFVDTHFAGTIASQLVNFDGSTTDVVLAGYNINPGSETACTICHDPHTAGKMLSVAAGQLDDKNNKAISYAVGQGNFHTDYLADPFSRRNTGCAPCHTGDDFPRLSTGATLTGTAGDPTVLATVPAGVTNRWAVVGCRSCHDLAQPNATPGTNNAAAFDDVRAFPFGYEYKFTAPVVPANPDAYAATFTYTPAAAVPVAELGASAICFECHKGRTAGVMPATEAAAGTTNYAISYLHYAPSAAILFGDEAKMALTYPGKTYAGRMAHYDGTKFNCTDCHNVHTGKDIMTEVGGSCVGCHGIAGPMHKDTLAARTEAYSVALLDAVYDAMIVAANGGVPNAALNATLKTKLIEIYNAADEATGKDILMTYIQERVVTFPSRTIAHAATTWKIFTYEDGPEHGQTHGHGGSWAHNSKFARQLMFDATESLVGVGNVVGITRP